MNGALAGLLGAVSVFALFVLPLWPMAGDRRWAWFLLPLALLVTSHWALLHETLHGMFHPRPGINRLAGRMLAIFGLTSFRVLRFGHLMHHRFNRYRLDRPDCYDPAEISPRRARLRFYVTLVGGLYLVEVAAPLLFLLPRHACMRIIERVYSHPDPVVQQVGQFARQSFLGPRPLRELRQDALLILAVLAGAFFAWGPDWPLLLLFLAARGAIVSLLDNVHHFDTPVEEVAFAHNLWLAPPLRLALLNMNLHRIHHREPHLPWWRLPARQRELADGYDGGYLAAATRQLRGPRPVSAVPPRRHKAAA